MYEIYSTGKSRRLVGRALTIEEAEHICQNRRVGTKSTIYKDGTYYGEIVSRPDQRGGGK